MSLHCGKHLNPIVPPTRCHPERIHEDARRTSTSTSTHTSNVRATSRPERNRTGLRRPSLLITPSPLPPTPPPPASPSFRSYSPSRPPSRTAAPVPPKSSADPPSPTGSPPWAVCLPVQSPVACDPLPSPSTRPCSTRFAVSKKSPAHSQCFRPSPAQIVHSSPARAPVPRAPFGEIPLAHTNQTRCSTSRHSPAQSAGTIQ